jgi:hypothetical protein
MGEFDPTKELPPDLEGKAAALWRADNPAQSVFNCDHKTKVKYRRRVLMQINEEHQC